VALGFELKASHLLRQALFPLKPVCQPFFVMGFFKDRVGLCLPGASFKLFAWGWL
jgi:hypothetical protein